MLDDGATTTDKYRGSKNVKVELKQLAEANSDVGLQAYLKNFELVK